MSEYALAVTDLQYAYPDGTQALRGVTFSVHEGEAVGIIGPNGAGKSTLLLHLAGAIAPQEGCVCVGEINSGPKTLEAVRSRVGLVLQDPDDQLFMPTIAEDVAFGPRNLGLTNEEVAERTTEALAAVGASHLAERAPYHLSGGEKRAASIATILSLQPDVLVMDEPTAGLDPRARRGVICLLDGFDHTRIVASHDLDMIFDTCSRVLLLADGKIVADGTADVLLQDQQLLERSGLELPLRLQ